MRRWVEVELHGVTKRATLTLKTAVDEYDYLSSAQLERAKEALRDVIEGVRFTRNKEGFLKIYVVNADDGKITKEKKIIEIWVKRKSRHIYDLREVTFASTGIYWASVEDLINWMIEKFRNSLEPEIQKVVRIA